jgi:hypothetical protein
MAPTTAIGYVGSAMQRRAEWEVEHTRATNGRIPALAAAAFDPSGTQSHNVTFNWIR